MTTRCRSCGAPVLWVTQPNGKAMILDANPDGTAATFDDGNIALRVSEQLFATDDGSTIGALHAVVKGRDDVGDFPHRSHFASCPQADQWRQR
jgi:hypothetical protein